MQPAAAIYGYFATQRQNNARPFKASLPVICVGNLVAGGAGKTPVALAIAERLKANGKHVGFLTRGYGGRLKGPVIVDAQHSARDVGDEALLLAASSLTVMSHCRRQGAETLVAAGVDVIVMDDGFQNTSVHKDFSLLVIDGKYGLGNGRLIPAGPLREAAAEGFARAQAIVLIDEDMHAVSSLFPPSLPVLRARYVIASDTASLTGKRVIAFAGIGRPEKFYDTVREAGCNIVKMIGFPDHHPYSARDLGMLAERAKEFDAALITTAKDAMRLPEDFRAQVKVLAVEAVFADEAQLLSLLQTALRS